MSKTVQEIQRWLLSPSAVKVLLVEISGVNFSTTLNDTGTIYLSSKPFITSTGINYNPCILGGISYTESLSLDGSPTISYGDIEIDNTDGSNDIYFSYYWNNRPINIYIGDITWARTDFALIFSGIVAELTTKNRNTINFVLLNTLSRLNTAVSDVVLKSNTSDTYGYVASNNIIAGYSGSHVIVEANWDKLRPVVFGECFNVTPVKVAEAYASSNAGVTYGDLYQIHNGPIERIIAVRDNGIDIEYVGLESDGCFTLLNASYGTITASVQGGYIGSYSSRLADVLRHLLVNYGGDYKLSHSDLEFPASSTTPYTGYYCSDKENVLDLANKLANSCGYQLVNTTVTAYVGSSTHEPSAGKVRLIPISLESLTEVYTIADADIMANSLNISQVLPLKANFRLGYCKNWTPLSDDTIAESLSATVREYFKKENLTERLSDSDLLTLYKDTTEPSEEESFVINQTDAVTEITRRFDLYSVPRYIVKMTCLPHMLFAQLGDAVKFDLQYVNKYSQVLVNTKTGIIFEIQRNWISNTIEIGVLI